MSDPTPEEAAAQEAAAAAAAAEAEAKKATKRVKARVLLDCVHGKCGDVVLVDGDVLAADGHKDTGLHQLDPHKASVAYAEGELRAKAEAARKKAEQA